MEEIKEKHIQDSLSPIPIKSMEIILEQMKKCVCKIHIGGTKGTGFFVKIPYRNEYLRVLITNNHIIGINEIINGEDITISLNNESIFKNISINSQRKRYTNEFLDVTIIELFEEKDGIKDFLSLDNHIIQALNLPNNKINNFLSNIYKNESIYLLNYLNGKDIFASYGLLSNINDNKIYHKCETNTGSSGSPIISLKSNKVIGVHYGSINSNLNFNIGRLLTIPIIEFQNINNNLLVINKNNKQEIIPLFVGLENIGQNCYMNPTLQCLCNIKELVDYFKTSEHLNKILKSDKKN